MYFATHKVIINEALEEYSRNQNFSLATDLVLHFSQQSACALIRVGDVKIGVLLLVLFVEGSHGGRGWRQGVVDDEIEGGLGSHAEPLPDDVHELDDGHV